MDRLTDRLYSDRWGMYGEGGLYPPPTGLRAVVDRLAAYENTGLMPAEVQALIATSKDQAACVQGTCVSCEFGSDPEHKECEGCLIVCFRNWRPRMGPQP